MRKMSTLAAVTALALAGCGGSGSVHVLPYPATFYDLADTMTAYAQTRHDYTLHASAGGNAYVLDLHDWPGSPQVFQGVTAQTTVRMTDIYRNGTLIANGSRIRYYLPATYLVLGDYDQVTGYLTLYKRVHMLPAAGLVGDIDTFDQGTIYYDLSATTVFGTVTDTWTLSHAAGDDALFCVYAAADTAAGTDISSDCYTIDLYEQVLGLRVTVTVDGTKLEFR